METKLFDPETFSHWQDIDPEGWKGIVQEIIDSFFTIVDAQSASLQQGFKEQNFELIQTSSHAMKSSLANVGCIASSKILRKMEELAVQKNWEQLQIAEKELNSLLLPSIKQLKEFRKKN